ncbi:MAG: class I SAM-dependent methyltransferase [Actinomycetota bacterium]
MSQFHFDPATYLDLIRSELGRYDEMQDAVAGATVGVVPERILDLGAGTGETARRVLALHRRAYLVGIDMSRSMLDVARDTLPSDRVDLRVGRLEDPLPPGPFELVVSALAIHHLPSDGKRDLFARIAGALPLGGLFVLGDVVVPARPEDAVAPLTPDFDRPDRADDQLRWLEETGYATEIVWSWKDLVVIRAGVN